MHRIMTTILWMQKIYQLSIRMIAHGVEDLLLGYRIGHGECTRDRAGHGCYCEDEVSSVSCEKELYLLSCIWKSR